MPRSQGDAPSTLKKAVNAFCRECNDSWGKWNEDNDCGVWRCWLFPFRPGTGGEERKVRVKSAARIAAAKARGFGKALPLLLLLLQGCATFPSYGDYGQLADSATTAVALESGFAEANPILSDLSWPVITAVKLGVSQASKLLPDVACVPAQTVLASAGFGAAVWNLGVIAGANPILALPVSLGVFFLTWEPSRVNSVAVCEDPWGANRGRERQKLPL